jgi:hypothetical protein
MTALAQAPVPLIAALTIFGMAFLGLIAKAVFAPTDEPTRRLCAILAIIRRQRPTRKDPTTELGTDRQTGETVRELVTGGAPRFHRHHRNRQHRPVKDRNAAV